MPDGDLKPADDSRLDSLFARSDDQIVIIDRDGVVRYANSAARALFGAAPTGVALDQTRLPSSAAAQLMARVGETLDSGNAISFRLEAPDGPVAKQITCQMSPIDEPGTGGAVLLSARDATPVEQALVRLREDARLAATLNRVGAALAAELDLQKLVQLLTDEATTLIGAQFGSFFYNVINHAGESYMLYTLSGVPREAFSKFPMPRNTAVFAPTFAGEGVVRSDDITKDPRYGKNSPYHGKPPGHLPVRSYLAVPVTSRTETVLGGLFFGHSEVGVFTEHDERILVAIAVHAAVAIDNARLYQQATDALARRAAAENELQISEERQRFAIEGAGIGTWHWDLVAGSMVWSDRCRALLGISEDQEASEPVFMARVAPEDRERVAKSIEMATAVPMDIHAEFRVPRERGVRWLLCKGRSYGQGSETPTRFEGILQDITERKRSEAALAAAYAKEHNIAATLQDALQPAPPAELPGLDVSAFYQPALDEASIGGDFYDVFALDKSVYALVVGDVSGKGLSAAAQVATVRNMLRCVLYQNRSVGDSVSAFNTILTQHDLLPGFVTVFAGIFDAGSRKLTYVSCGHEPALVRRRVAGQRVEELPAAGLPLGASATFPYHEREIALAAGDTLVLYTDGLSEAGPDRRRLLNTEGLAKIIQESDPALSADELKTRIVDAVKAYAGADLNDDACLMVAVVK